MAETIVTPTESPSVLTSVERSAESAAKFVGNAVRAAGQSIANDGATFVAKDASIGARVEAGVNLAADVASVVTLSPEDAALERGAVFAIKESVEHAPQLAEGAVALGKQGIKEIAEHAPQIEKAVGTAFERSKAVLEAGEHAIVDSSVKRGLIETKNAVYSVVEGAQHDGTRLLEHFSKALESGKNFAVHAPELGEEAAGRLRGMPLEAAAKRLGLKTVIADTEHTIEASVKTLENSSVERTIEAVGKKLEPISKVIDPIKKVKEAALGVAGVATAAYAERDKIGHVAHEAAEHVEHIATDVSHHVGQAVHATETAIEHGVAAASNGVKSVVDDVKHWTPDMSAEHFEKMLGLVRGGNSVPSQAPTAPARSQQHGIGH